MLQALIFKGFQTININAVNDRGDTPLHLASRWGFGKWVSLRVVCMSRLPLQAGGAAA